MKATYQGTEMNGTSPRKMGKSLGRISVPQIAQILALKPQDVPFGTEIIYSDNYLRPLVCGEVNY